MTGTAETTESPRGGIVYALLVGIDEYLPPVPALYGCKNDIEQLSAYLTKRLGDRLRPLKLLDRSATRQAVIDGFRVHLGQAGPGDVVVFAYSGHGSEEPAPETFLGRDATGKLQSLICADSCRRVGGVLVRPLADKELAVLISDAAARGAHVAVILDCCHSGNGTRDAAVRVRQWLPDPSRARDTDRVDLVALTTPRPVEEFIDGASTAQRMSDHVALFACQPFQLAKETTVGWQARGAFSVALLDALGAVGPGTTYRSLLAAVRTRVERTAGEQEPVLFPTDPNGPADTLVFDGAVQSGPISFHLTKDVGGWEVDAGSIHGITAPADGEAYEFTCTEEGTASAAGVVRVTEVEPARCFVEPQGWEPRDIAYEAVISSVPLPLAVVQVESNGGAAADEAVPRLAAVVASCGPGGGASPYIRLAGGAVGLDALVLRVAACAGGYEVRDERGVVLGRQTDDCLRLLRADGTAVGADVPGFADAALRTVVARLEHVARWEQVRGLGGHTSALRDAVRLELIAVPPGVIEMDVTAVWPPYDPATGFELVYRHDELGGGWEPPSMFIRVVNSSDRDLFVAVLDLTDRYRCHAGLFPTARISAGVTVEIRDGRAIPATLPEGRAPVAGASARDWLKVIVSETDFDATAFEMPALDEPFTVTRSIGGPRSTLERLATRAITRDLGSTTSVVGSARPDWCAQTYPVTIRVPDP